MTIAAPAFAWVRDVVESDAAILIDAGKEYLVESRLAALARAAGAPDVSSYVLRTRDTRSTAGREAIVTALTTNETSWFRDSGPFNAFANQMLPELVRRRAGRPLRVWSAACSTGQEPYSIAMLLREAGVPASYACEVLATDFSSEVLRTATKAEYTQIEVNRGLPVQRLLNHFTKHGTHWRVNEDVRQLVSFRQLNLARPFGPIGDFDVVFLRNVLIYFSVPTRREILQRVQAITRPDGYLVLGGAETTIGVDESWRREQIGPTPVYRPGR